MLQLSGLSRKKLKYIICHMPVYIYPSVQLSKSDKYQHAAVDMLLTIKGHMGLTSTCWQVWINFPIRDSSSLFLLIRLLRLESRACCGKQITQKRQQRKWKTRKNKKVSHMDVKKPKWRKRCKYKEDKNAERISSSEKQKRTSNKKVIKRVEKSCLLENTRKKKHFDSSVQVHQITTRKSNDFLSTLFQRTHSQELQSYCLSF